MRQKSKTVKFSILIIMAIFLGIAAHAEEGKYEIGIKWFILNEYVYEKPVTAEIRYEKNYADMDAIIMDTLTVTSPRTQLTTGAVIGDHGLALTKTSRIGLSVDSLVSIYAWQVYRDEKRLSILEDLDRFINLAKSTGSDSDISELNDIKLNIRYRKFSWRVNSIDRSINGRTR